MLNELKVIALTMLVSFLTVVSLGALYIHQEGM